LSVSAEEWAATTTTLKCDTHTRTGNHENGKAIAGETRGGEAWNIQVVRGLTEFHGGTTVDAVGAKQWW
jgi:hypothetical protein